MQSLPQRIAVTDYVQATRTALTTDLDVRGPFPNPLKDLELIPDAYWFSESGLWATILKGTRVHDSGPLFLRAILHDRHDGSPDWWGKALPGLHDSFQVFRVKADR